jgi:hypothetical protein
MLILRHDLHIGVMSARLEVLVLDERISIHALMREP